VVYWKQEQNLLFHTVESSSFFVLVVSDQMWVIGLHLQGSEIEIEPHAAINPLLSNPSTPRRKGQTETNILQTCDSSSTFYTNKFTNELLTELPQSSLRYLGSEDSPVRTQLKKITDKDRDLLHQLHLLLSPRAQSRLVDHILSARKQRELQLQVEEE
jgi:hypothetical protein